jgi:hypothetical protein
MNKFLAEILGFLNGLLALLIILSGAAIGVTQVGGSGAGLFGLFFGLIGGIVTAGIVCGLLAIFIEIRSELIKIRIELTERPLPAAQK